jgi:uncharacterized membrane protein
MNAKTTKTVKKVLRQVPPRAIEAGAALVIGKAFKSNRKVTGIIVGAGVVVLAHYVAEWASKD